MRARGRATMAIGLAPAVAFVVFACGSFGSTADDSRDGGLVEAGAGPTADGASGKGYCESLVPPAAFCDDFTFPPTPSNWMFVRQGNASVGLVDAGSTPPSLRMRLEDGGKCFGDQGVFVLQRDFSDAGNGLRVGARLSIDRRAEMHNAGQQVIMSWAVGHCSFYVGWQDAVPRIKVDFVPDGLKREDVFDQFPLTSVPIPSGGFMHVLMELRPVADGTVVKWRVDDGPEETHKVEKCVGTRPTKVQLTETCSTGELQLDVDDVAVWLP